MTVIISDEAVNIALNTWLGGIPAWRNDATERLRTEMRAALTAALPFLPVQGAVKKLAWGPVSENGNDIQSFSTLGKYVISIDDAPAGGTHYLWIAGQSDSSDYHSSYQNMFEAKAAAQADYEARILSALEPSAGDMGNPITLDIGKPITAPSAARELALEEAAHNLINELSGNPGELIDKMAEAIRDWGSHYDDGPWETLPEDRKAGWRGDAERALAAVKEYLTTRALSSPDHADAGKVEGDGWLPIESAPKDGTVIDLWSDEYGRLTDCYWGAPMAYEGGETGWVHAHSNEWAESPDEFVHWRPLPLPPVKGGQNG